MRAPRGKPGVAFVITGPGLTNTITAMGQARADSVPMLVISGVNATATLGKGLGHLHELPDQRGMMEKVALSSHRIAEAGRTARRAGRRLRAVRQRAAGAGPYRDPDRRDGHAGGCRSRRSSPMSAPPAPDAGRDCGSGRAWRQAARAR